MGQAKQRKVEIAKLKILSKPRDCTGFDIFWQVDKLVNGDGIYDLPSITNKIADWAAHPEGLGFTGKPKVEVKKSDSPFHNECVQITLLWNKSVKIDGPAGLGRLAYILRHGDNGYSGAEFYMSTTEMLEELQALEAA